MTECCAKCKYLFEMEDWTDYPRGQYFRKVCGLFANEKSVMALYGDLNSDYCEGFAPRRVAEITAKQRELIEDMNEFCQEKFDFTGKDRKQASEYISRNIEEFKLVTMSSWQLSYM